MLQRALAIREQTQEPDHPDTASSLNTMATLSAEQGKYARAESFLRRALAIREQTLRPDYFYIAQSLGNLSIIYAWKGKTR